MEMNHFAEKIREAVGKELEEGYEVKIRQVQKNNGICRTGLIVLAKDGNVTPGIYLEDFHAAYEAGAPFKRIVRQITEAYHRNKCNKNIDLEFFRDFGRVQDRICYRLVGRKGNEVLLKEIPHMEFLDLAICFYYAYYSDALGEGSILIHNSYMEMWHTCTEELFRLAQVNTPRLFPWRCGSQWEVLAENARVIQGEEGAEAGLQEAFPDEIPMKVLTNSKRSSGAVCILYPGVLEEVAAERMGGDFYIIPSSVHEVILLPDDGRLLEENLKEMIFEVNRTKVDPEEVLSDNLYYYDAERKETRLL